MLTNIFKYMDYTLEGDLEDAQPTPLNSIYILKCGHVMVCYHASSARAVVRHRSSCLRRGRYIFEDDHVLRIPLLTKETLVEAIEKALTPSERKKLESVKGL